MCQGKYKKLGKSKTFDIKGLRNSKPVACKLLAFLYAGGREKKEGNEKWTMKKL